MNSSSLWEKFKQEGFFHVIWWNYGFDRHRVQKKSKHTALWWQSLTWLIRFICILELGNCTNTETKTGVVFVFSAMPLALMYVTQMLLHLGIQICEEESVILKMDTVCSTVWWRAKKSGIQISPWHNVAASLSFHWPASRIPAWDWKTQQKAKVEPLRLGSSDLVPPKYLDVTALLPCCIKLQRFEWAACRVRPSTKSAYNGKAVGEELIS